MKNTMIAIFTLFISFSTYSCKGEKGDTGPTGPSGQSGSNGNANVTTTTFQLSSSQWTILSSGGPSASTYGYFKYISQLTQHLADSGLVNVDIQTPTGWTSMPLTVPISAGFTSYTYSYKKDTVSIFKSSAADTTSRFFKITIADKN